MKKPYYFWHVDDQGKCLLSHTKNTWYQTLPNGKGDCIWRTSLYILTSGDSDATKTCIKLLQERKRWKDTLNDPYDSCCKVEKWIHKDYYHSQHTMSRDPFIMLFCALYWHHYEMIQDLTIPFYIQRPALYHWVQYLKTMKPIHKLKYEDWAVIDIALSETFGYPGYVKHLNSWMAFIAKSQRVKERILPNIPDWNLLCRMLCGDRLTAHDQENIKNYVSKEGYQWQQNKWMHPGIDVPRLSDDNPIYLDKEILDFVHNVREW